MRAVLSSRVALRCFYFAFFVAVGAYFPYFPSWLKEQGIDGIRMGILSSILPALTVIGPPGFGMLADAMGLRGSLLRFSSLGALLSFGTILLFALTGKSLGFTGLFVCILFFGFFRTPMQLLSDVVALEQGGNYGRQRLFGSLGFMLTAPLVGYFIDLRSPIALPAVVVAGLVFGHLATWPLPTHSAVPRPAVLADAGQLVSRPEFRLFLIAVMLGQTAHVGFDVTLSLHLAALGFSGTMIGVAWAIGTAAEVLLMATAAPLLSRYAPAKLLLVSLLVGAVRLALLGSLTSPMWILLLQPLHAISFALRWLAAMQIVRQQGVGGPLGTAQGIHLAAYSLGSVVGTLIFSALFKEIGGHLVLKLCSLTALCAAATALPLAIRGAYAALAVPR